jgi:Putative zinc-finger
LNMKWMQRLGCEQASRLMSRRRDEPLSAWQGAQLQLHLRLCGDCREVDRQLGQIGTLAGSLWREDRDAERDAERDAQR